MIVTTGMDVSGKEVAEYLGVVRGIVVRATGIGRGIVGGLKSIAGGNIEEFTVVCEEARMEAFNRMVRHAHEINADAVIAMRYDATEFSQGATEVLAYGTAVKLR
ncbi:MAG TPA: YbjQ family protein [Pyrinomonadaceae bacterium]|nr:YbjQ family protein [Pyrinomonadaceae bacterium]